MSEWKETTLGEISNYINRGISPKYVVCNGDIVLNQRCIRDGRINFEHVKLTDKKTVVNNAKWLKNGDILINSTGVGTVGRVALVRNIPKATVDSHVSIVRVENYIADSTFVFYYLRPRETEIESFAEGSTGQVELGRERLNLIDILLPSLPEQRAIASVLSSLDDKIDLLHRQNRTLEAMAETLFRQWFIEEADEEWEEGKVFDYCTHYKNGVNPQDMPTEIFLHYSIPAFDNNMNPVIERGTEIQSNKYSVVPNCLLFSKLNPNKDKRIWLILDLLSENPVCSTEFQVVLPRNNKYLFFIYSWLSISHNYNEIASGAGGTSGSHQRIDPVDIFNFPCPRIEDSYISAYNEAVAPLFFKMNKNRFQIRTLEKLRDTLLPKLMSGDVRVSL